MNNFTPLLAEVADKEPGLFFVWSIAATISIACFLLCRWRRWGLLFALPLPSLSIYATVTRLRDPHEGFAIVRELGRGYGVQAWVAGFVPLLFTAAGCFTHRAGHENAA